MRNLKKILAMALAMVMAFSVMATASAFSDDESISETYSDAIDVLSGLGVFEGDDRDGDGVNEFRPKDPITRAEVAAILYRLATGDVDNNQDEAYAGHADFDDLAGYSWADGYIGYCYNAEYILGYNGKFNPGDNINGYAVLAMVLRAVGYDQEGEFQGEGWEIRTASKARELGILKNVSSNDDVVLSQHVSRELVAELLFQASLVDTVEWTMLNRYTETGESLAERVFGLEEVEGVVVANEWANLYGTSVLADGRTNLELEDGDIYTLDLSSELTDVGESRYAYVTTSKGISTVLALGDTGKNVVAETGDATDISTAGRFRTFSGLNRVDGETEYYVNFGRDGYSTSDWRIEYNLAFTTVAAQNAFEDDYGDVVDAGMTWNAADQLWKKVIRAEADITDDDLEIIRGIFAVADDRDQTLGVEGSVYVGTTSGTGATGRDDDDVSDDMSYRQFVAQYINDDRYDRNFTGSENGEWLKVVDNDGDGDADYAFLTEYWLDEVIHTRKSGDTVINEYFGIDRDDETIVELDELEVGDVVVYSLIDGKAVVELAESDTDVVNYVSFKDEILRTVGGDEYGQSYITNNTEMDELVINMDEEVEYIMYFDKYGFVRAYELTAGTQYGLITELYADNYWNGRYVEDEDLIVELKSGAEDVEEFLVTSGGAAFESTTTWENMNSPYQDVENDRGNNISGRIILQPATAHLGLRTANRAQYYSPAMTNVGEYTETAEGEVRLESAAEFMFNRQGQQLFYTNVITGPAPSVTTEILRMTQAEVDAENRDGDNVAAEIIAPVYAVDYIELTNGDIAADQQRWSINDTTGNRNNVDPSWLLNDYVNATSSTEFYVIYNDDNVRRGENIEYFVGYQNVPRLTNARNNIQSVYAVARNTSSDADEQDYWVADVIVIELNTYNYSYDSHSLVYFNPDQTTDRVRLLNTLNNEHEGVDVDVIPDDRNWGGVWNDGMYRFYGLYDTALNDDGDLTADVIQAITSNFSDHGIFAVEIQRTTNLLDYVDVREDLGAGNLGAVRSANITDDTKFYQIEVDDSGRVDVYEAEELHPHLRSEDRDNVLGHDAILVVDDDALQGSDVIYAVIVDLDDTPAWVGTLYNLIVGDQARPGDTNDVTLVNATGDDADGVFNNPYTADSNGIVRIPVADVAKAGYIVTLTKADGTFVTDTATIGGTNYYLMTGVTADTTVTVEYTAQADTLTVSVKGGSYVYSTGLKVEDSVGNNVNSTTVTSGTQVKVTFEVVPGYVPVVNTLSGNITVTADDITKVAGATPVNSGDVYTFTFVMDGSAPVSLELDADPAPVDGAIISVSRGSTLTGLKTVADNFANKEGTYTVTMPHGSVMPNGSTITSYVQVNGDPSTANYVQTAGTNTWTYTSAGTNGGKNKVVTIKFENRDEHVLSMDTRYSAALNAAGVSVTGSGTELTLNVDTARMALFLSKKDTDNAALFAQLEQYGTNTLYAGFRVDAPVGADAVNITSLQNAYGDQTITAGGDGYWYGYIGITNDVTGANGGLLDAVDKLFGYTYIFKDGSTALCDAFVWTVNRVVS